MIPIRPLKEQFKKKLKNSLFKNITITNSVILVLLPLISVLISFIFNPNFFTSILLFLGAPSIYISFRAPKYIIKSFVFSMLAGIPLMIILEYFGGISSTWAFFNIYAVVIFYEYIFDNHSRVHIWNRKMWTLMKYILVWVVIFVITLVFSSRPIVIPYFYLLFGLIILIFPIMMTWLYYPKNLTKIILSLMRILIGAVKYLIFTISSLGKSNWHILFKSSQR